MAVGSERFGQFNVGLHLGLMGLLITISPFYPILITAFREPPALPRKPSLDPVQLCRLGLQLMSQSSVGALITNSLLCLFCMGDRASGYLRTF